MYEDLIGIDDNKYGYYILTNEDKEWIIKYFNDRNLEDLLDFCTAVGIAASNYGWARAEQHLKDVGEERFFQDCRNCGHRFDCEPEFALNECGERYEKWVKSNK